MELILRQTYCGEFKSDLIVLGGVLNDALGRVGLGCVVRLPVTPVLLPGPRHFSGQSRGDDRRFPVADRCHFVPHLIAGL